MQRLHTELAKRQADERLTELVRRSADAIAVIGVDGRFSYLSPAAERLFGAPVEALVGRSTADLFGSKGALRLGALAAPSDSDSIADVELVTSSGERKLLQIAANNQSANPVIAGVVLTVHDVTEQRRVEQEILDVATRERQLLSRNVHEGLAQELTGVALMLNALNRRSNDTSAPAQASLDAVIRYVSEAIGGVRQLAVSLSPLQIASGSLQLALNGLARDVSTHSAIRVSTDWHLGDQVLPDGVADHLYHIVQEAISHAAEDTQCREVRICLRGVPLGLELSIESNGAGARIGVAAGDGRSLRLIAYRVRLLGGTLRVDGSAGGGTHIVAVTPIPVALPGQG
jgi:PAS domain S-box-containing protein